MMISMEMQQLARDALCWEDGQLQSTNLNPDHGYGCLSKVVTFPSGVSMVVQNFSLYGDREIRLFRENADLPFIGFFTCFSGVRHVAYAGPRVHLGSGFTNIEFAGYKPARFMEVKPNTPVKTLIVCVDPSVLKKLTGKTSHDLVENLERLDFNADRKSVPVRSKDLDFSQNICGNQAFASFFSNPRDTLFLEAKALEMIALQLRQLDVLTGNTFGAGKPDYHTEKIHQACQILKKEMANPPKARELARRVGLNHNQLVHMFKQVLGVYPFEYLRTIRLETARKLILGRRCNITEAAFQVGYASLSHFTTSFRKEFGKSPKAYLKKSS